MNTDLDQRLRRFIDGSLAPDEARSVLHAVAEDPEARELLRFEHLLQRRTREASEERAQPVPAGFTDRVMEAVEASEAEVQPASPTEGLVHWRRRFQRLLLRVRDALLPPGRWRLAYAGTLAVLLIAGSFLGGRLTAPLPSGEGSSAPMAQSTDAPNDVRRTTTEERKRLVRFTYVNNEADSVAVAGDFTGWEPIALDPHTVDGKTVWSGMVPVAPGDHRYMFVINGEQWVQDPLAPVQRDDGFGNKNAVLTI